MIKMIASDMDGTLLNRSHDISEENLQAVKKVQDMGIEFVIATGREIDSVKPILEKHNINCECVLANGAEYRDKDGNIIESININNGQVKDIIRILSNNGMVAELYTNKGICTNNTKEESLDGFAYMMMTFEGISYEEALEKAKFEKSFLRMNYIEDIDEFLNDSLEVRKIYAFHRDIEKVEKSKVEVEELGGLAVSSSFVSNIEITNIDAQKGLILEKVAKKKGINKDEVIVLGDSFNDLSMFKTFVHTVAMENALPEIKKVARYITDSNENAGVAKAIYNILNQEN